MASCGQKEIAVRLLKSAIESHYCAYAALQNDFLLKPLRGTPEFSQLLSAAKDCQDNFSLGESAIFALNCFLAAPRKEGSARKTQSPASRLLFTESVVVRR